MRENEREIHIVQKMSSKTYHDIPSVTHTKPSSFSLVETTSAFSSFEKKEFARLFLKFETFKPY